MNNEILRSIRSHLAASAPEPVSRRLTRMNADQICVNPRQSAAAADLFRLNLEAVNGHCVIVQGETEIARALTRIITDLQKTDIRAERIAISDNPLVERLMHLTDLEIEALTIAPNDIFSYDVGISTVQAAIAETGTLVLVSADERHRLVSLVPPVHIAIVDASRICETLAEALTLLRNGRDLSRAVTFITGPSRTADIELTLTVGVHGPQELYVIVNG